MYSSVYLYARTRSWHAVTVVSGMRHSGMRRSGMRIGGCAVHCCRQCGHPAAAAWLPGTTADAVPGVLLLLPLLQLTR